MADLSWPLILGLASTGILMALVSALAGMRPRIENPAWWALYAVWVTVVLATHNPAPFRTILFASAIAGVLHGITLSLLLGSYIRKNPWYADQLDKPPARLRARFVMMGVAIGLGFGALVAGVAWALRRFL